MKRAKKKTLKDKKAEGGVKPISKQEQKRLDRLAKKGKQNG